MSDPLTKVQLLSCTTVFTTANTVRPDWAVERLGNSFYSRNMSIPFLASHWGNQIKEDQMKFMLIPFLI